MKTNLSRTSLWTARIAVALLWATPLLWALWASLQPVERIFHAETARSAADFPRWENYSDAITLVPLLRWVANAVLITVSATLGTILSASMAGFAFARLRWRGRRLGLAATLVMIALPGQALLITQFLIFERLGWVNTYKPLIVPAWLGGSAFAVLFFYHFFRGVPRAMQDAARLDGATAWQVYWLVFLPLARPVVATVAALCSIMYWHAFIGPLVYLSDYQTYPVSIGLRMFQAMEGSWANLILSASLLTMLPLLLGIVLMNRRLFTALSISDAGH